ncbi:MAG: hypothetical protein NTX82_07345 [Candidatus Parcubacteria bacterium]|nr:hypothetical protein [Candidatus Parcubacteria bacterium]
METTTKPEIMRGHVEECLAHIAQKLLLLGKRSPQKKEVIATMANFCGVTHDPASRWLHGSGSMPIGDQKIKLMCWLDLIGFRIIELENMTESFRGITELIAFGLITGADAAKIIGYAEPSTVYKVIYEQMNTTTEKKEIIWQLVKGKKTELLQAKENAIKQLPAFAATLLPSTLQTEPAKPEPESVDTELIGSPANTFTQGFLSLLQGINTLLESEAATRLTDQELAALPASQSESISKLATKLTALKNRLKNLKGQNGDANGSG